ncbi:hypothetical protein Cni_G06468 [Canna indica]|uniref:Uncharacterized protein n=1 Tax=Canna indica TaxID=4628 RepID=A0AAQ3K1K9_9LILI|nr:hypothetical protein Cni_G06468 [Canna indica]
MKTLHRFSHRYISFPVPFATTGTLALLEAHIDENLYRRLVLELRSEEGERCFSPRDREGRKPHPPQAGRRGSSSGNWIGEDPKHHRRHGRRHEKGS